MSVFRKSVDRLPPMPPDVSGMSEDEQGFALDQWAMEWNRVVHKECFRALLWGRLKRSTIAAVVWFFSVWALSAIL